MTALFRISSLTKGVLLASIMTLFSVGLKAQITINNSTSCNYEVTVVGAELTSSVYGDCDAICWASETTFTVGPGTSSPLSITGCPAIAPVRATVKQAGCAGSPSVTVEVPLCSCGAGDATDSDTFTIPLGCCDPGATITVSATCGLGAMTINID